MTTPMPESPPPQQQSVRFSLIGAVTRLWSLRRLPGPLPTISDWVICASAAVSLGLWLVLDHSAVGPDAEFFPYGIPNVAWFAAIGLLIAWALARRSQPMVEFRSAIFVVAAAMPIVVLAGGLTETFVADDAQVYAYSVIALYIVIYVARAGRSLTGKPQIPAAAIVALVLIGIGWFNIAFEVNPQLWTEAEPDSDDDSANDPAWTRGETLLFSQPARVDEAVARVKPSASNAPQVYFVGFAGYGEQQVFAEEIKLAAFNIGRKYGSSERSVLLVNDRRDLDKLPLATVSGLGRALKGLASRMNVDRDVLFLALSSHGSAAPLLSVSLGPLPLYQLTGDALARAIKDSGIKWKIIVISACHAGAFIDALKDDRTIVLTAAAAQKTSFGCSDDRDLTYFGEAFYRDAIPTTSGLHAAFAQTVREIAAREKQEDIEASDPQAFFGKAMDAKLAEIEQAQQTAR